MSYSKTRFYSWGVGTLQITKSGNPFQIEFFLIAILLGNCDLRFSAHANPRELTPLLELRISQLIFYFKTTIYSFAFGHPGLQYLAALKKLNIFPSISYFKNAVYGFGACRSQITRSRRPSKFNILWWISYFKNMIYGLGASTPQITTSCRSPQIDYFLNRI